MKNLLIKFGLTLVILMLGAIGVTAQNIVAPANADAAESLDLYAVGELLKDSENLEKFEEKLNDSETGINNLDLNDDQAVDFVRVTEQIAGDTHLVVLQTTLGEDEFQDVATVAFERESGEKYNLQIQGDAEIYGANYYVVPANNDFGAWNVVRWIFRPNYRPYVSTYNYRSLPRWWKVRRPVAVNVYRGRADIFAGRRNFTSSRSVTVKTIGKINYRPRTSTVITRKKVTQTRAVTNRNGNPNQTQTTTRTKTKTVRGKRQ